MATAGIELKNVSLEFNGQSVLRDVSLSISPSEKFVLIGPSGQGKTSLLKLMAGLILPSRGEVFIAEQSINNISDQEKQQILCTMGMLFQKNALFDSLTCGENIAFPLREVRGLDEAQINVVVDKFLDAVGISHAKHLFPDEISGGMQKRLGIARALALEPSIIFYDDPTAGLDPITSKKIIELILELQKKNRSTVVAVTNDMNRAYQLADRIGMVIGGEVIVTGNAGQTKACADARVHQFIRGELLGPLTAAP